MIYTPLPQEQCTRNTGMFPALLAAMQPDGFCHALAVAERYTLG